MRTAYGDSLQTGTHFANYSTVRLQPVAYSASGLPEAKSFLDWKNFASAPYTSQTHGDRFVVNHANDIAEEPYGRYENIGTMPPGGIIAKPSFTISPNGNVQLRSEEHTSELQSLMRISYAVFCLKKKNTHTKETKPENTYNQR